MRPAMFDDRQIVVSVVRTRRGGAMIARMPCRRISRSIRPRLAPRPCVRRTGVNPGAAIALAAITMDLPDLGQQRGIGGCVGAHRTLAPSVIARRRHLEYGTHQPYRIAVAVVFDETEAQKIAIDFLRNSRIGVARNGLQHEA
ncbi:hypothetical protein [Bradyrhizobium niftali]|uniref:hypothetical protein n=1 Tax=Bradyrhizobium niftali TaxID=2560055 RepID=UPI0014304E07|nr:hypothetical protein [Bradyrhizobium niftali]